MLELFVAVGIGLAMILPLANPLTTVALLMGLSRGMTEAERLLAFCNNSGPAFILGVVGVGVFGSSRVGLLLYLAHAAASICPCDRSRYSPMRWR